MNKKFTIKDFVIITLLTGIEKRRTGAYGVEKTLYTSLTMMMNGGFLFMMTGFCLSSWFSKEHRQG